jgi:hypothetical protein
MDQPQNSLRLGKREEILRSEIMSFHLMLVMDFGSTRPLLLLDRELAHRPNANLTSCLKVIPEIAFQHSHLFSAVTGAA